MPCLQAAAEALQLLADSIGSTPSALTAAYAAASSREDTKDVTTRRLLPLKSLPLALGTAASVEFCCRLQASQACVFVGGWGVAGVVRRWARRPAGDRWCSRPPTHLTQLLSARPSD